MTTKDNLIEEYKINHPGSAKLHEQAVSFFTANGSTHASRIIDPFRPYITHAKGSRKWDVDGNEYIDYVTGHGSLIFGHSHPVLVQAVQDQMAKGVHYGECHELELEWARLIQRLMPMAERVEYCACGQEANLMAIRLARAFTGRKKVLRFEENFHGWAGEVGAIGSPGVIAPEVKIIPMNDINKVEAELATKEYAIIFTEGGGAHAGGQIPWDTNFIRALPDLTKQYGTVWLMDEVVTGFREAPGGWQSLVGVTPDLSTLGKCVSGGIPVGVVVGRADILEAFNPKAPPERRIRHTGTWNANPLICASGIAACKMHLNGEPQRKAAEIGAYLRQKGNKILKKRKISGSLYGRTAIHFYFGPFDYEPSDETLPPTLDVKKHMNPAMMPIKSRLCLHLLHRGVATLGGRFFMMMSVHTKEDVDQTMEALDDALGAMIAEGTISKDLMLS